MYLLKKIYFLQLLYSNEKLLKYSDLLCVLLFYFPSDTYEPDGYNPEAPSITSSGRSQYRQFFSRTQTQRPNLIGLTSGDMDANPRGESTQNFSGAMCYIQVGYNISDLSEALTYYTTHCL